MIELHLYGNLRRLAPDKRGKGERIIQYESHPGETINMLLASLGVTPDQISTLFYNHKLLATRIPTAAIVEFRQVDQDPEGWNLDVPLQPGDRLGIFGTDMQILV